MFDWLGRIKDNDIASFPYCNFGFFDLIIMPITLRNCYEVTIVKVRDI